MTDPVGEEEAPAQQPSLTRREDTYPSRHYPTQYGATGGISSALSPVDEERQSRPKPTQTQNHASAQLSTSTFASAQPLSAAMDQAAHGVPTVSAPHLTNTHIYQRPATAIMGPLTPPRSPLAGEVMYHSQQQQLAVSSSSTSGGGPITPPRTTQTSSLSKGSAKRSKSKSQRSGGKRSSKKSNKQAPDTTLFTEMSKGGVASSIKKSLSNISLFTAADGDTGDEEAASATSTSLGFGGGSKSYHDDDLTSAHHRAELYGQIGGPTGMIGAFGDKRGCKRFLVLITLAFILLSLVLERISDGTTDGGNGNGNSEGGTKEGTNAASLSSQEIDSFLKGEIGELTPGKCRQIIDKQTADLEETVGKNDELEKEIRRLENVIDELKERLQAKEKQGNEAHGR